MRRRNQSNFSMTTKLEKLALSSRRSPSEAEEWVDPDAAFKVSALLEREDRMKGDFPYGDKNIKGVKEFYAGKDILITGGSGFMGKVLIEKILRSLPEAGKVYLLLRGRKGLSPQQRIQAMLELPLFKLLMTENPEAAQRLVAMDGDCGSLGLGLSPTDRQTLIDNVSIVFHCAATVRFDLNANYMIMVNTRGTRDVVYLCKELKKLESFVHVSTAYTNSTKGRKTPVPEKVTRQHIDWRTMISVAEKLEGNPAEKTVLDLMFEKVAPQHHNNYTFTKALAEDVVSDEAKDLPVIIVRPPVVVPSMEDPFGGWVDNLYGPMSVWDAIGQGVVRVHYGLKDLALEYQPVDLNVKNLLIAAWHRGIGFRTSSVPEEVDVINNGTKNTGTHTANEIHTKMHKLYERHSHPIIFRYPRLMITNSFWLFWFVTVTAHLPLGVLVDAVLMLKGRKPMLTKIYRTLYMAQTRFLQPFSAHAYVFDQDWQYKIRARMWRKEDRDRLDWVSKLYVTSYYNDTIEGIIKYVFKKPALPHEKTNRQLMWYIDWIQNALLAYFGWCFLSWMYFRLLAAM